MTAPRIYTHEDLALFDLLTTHVWVVDLDRGNQWWANLASLPMWGLDSREELLLRSAAARPSETSRTRLDALRRKFERGERSIDRWTLYPDLGKPFVAECKSSGIRIADFPGDPPRLGMLIEARVLDGSEADPQDRRGIEALRYLGELVSLHAESGEALMRNPAAVRALGDPGPGDQFTAGFVDPAQAADARARIAAGAVYRADALIRTAGGERWYDTVVRRSLDPVTGAPALLVLQTDITERRAQLAELERSRQQIADQADALRRLAAPVIRVSAGVLALPLIGALDRDRIDLALAALLAHTARGGVARVVLDLTGAAAVDPTAAAGLLRIVRVLRLQGVASALSGVRPDLARAIAGAGLDLSETPCHQTVEDALARG